MKKPLKYLIIAVLASLLTLTACGASEAPTNNIGEVELVDGDPFAHLRIPFVGAAHETQAVVNVLQLPGESWIVGSIQIGQDHGDFAESYSPYTLTIFYEPRSGSIIEGSRELPTIPTVVFEENSTLLFEVIENLQAVTFSVRFNPAEGGEADNSLFDYRWSRSRHGEYSLQFGDENEDVSDFAVHIDLMSNVNLGFNVLHEVNYNDVFEEIRGFRFDGEGVNLIIWANQPIFNLSLIALDHNVVDFYVAEAVFTVDKLDSAAAHAFVINSYYGMGTMPWSGIAFEDTSGARWYYMLQQSGYDGRFFLNEFVPAVDAN